MEGISKIEKNDLWAHFFCLSYEMKKEPSSFCQPPLVAKDKVCLSSLNLTHTPKASLSQTHTCAHTQSFKKTRRFSFVLSLSLSHTHTQTHTHRQTHTNARYAQFKTSHTQSLPFSSRALSLSHALLTREIKEGDPHSESSSGLNFLQHTCDMWHFYNKEIFGRNKIFNCILLQNRFWLYKCVIKKIFLSTFTLFSHPLLFTS